MTKLTVLTQEGINSYGIKVETAKDEFVIPVLDVRDGQNTRDRIMVQQKNVNYSKGSKYMRQTYSMGGNCYQNSHKKSI